MTRNCYDIQFDRFTIPPTMCHRNAFKFDSPNDYPQHWALITEVDVGGEEVSYELRVRHLWNGESWNQFAFYVVDYASGDPVRLMTSEEHHDGMAAVEEHEGEDAAHEWDQDETRHRVMRGFESKLKDALIRRWVAISELVGPAITL